MAGDHSSQPGRRGGGVYPLTGADAFRSIETEYATGLLMCPHELVEALDSLKAAGVADGELADIAAHHERVVADNEKLRIETQPNAVDPRRVDAVRVSVRGECGERSGYGRHEEQNDITPEHASLSRVHDDRWDPLVKVLSPERTFQLIEPAKAEHPELAAQLDALYEAVRYPNAVEWAHQRRILGQISEETRRYAEPMGRPACRLGGRTAARHREMGHRACGQRRPAGVEAGTPVTVLALNRSGRPPRCVPRRAVRTSVPTADRPGGVAAAMAESSARLTTLNRTRRARVCRVADTST